MMLTFHPFILLSLATFVTSTKIDAVHENGAPLVVDRKYYRDLLMVLQWPPGLCYKSWCNSNPGRWTIHGLWPEGPYDCYQTTWGCNLRFGYQATHFAERMKSSWPSVKGWTNQEFWEHEYCKHGTCANDILPGPVGYFKGALDLYDSVLRKLLSAGISPSFTRTYSFDQVERALGYKPKYWCKTVGDKQVLYQLGVSFTKSFIYKDGNGRHSKCTTYKPFYLMPEQ